MALRHFPLLAITTILLVTLLFLSPPASAHSPVLDMDGNPLEVGSQYYVLTAGTRGAGRGGLTHASKPPRLCPRYVAQHSSWRNNGRPVRFYPPNPSKNQITQGDDVNIAFQPPVLCRDSGVWRINFDNVTNVPYVATNGVVGNHGTFETFHNWFKLEKAFRDDDFTYRIVFCFAEPQPFPGPGGDDDDVVVGKKRRNCKQLDAIQGGPNGVSFLGLVPLEQNLPFIGFVFKKVDTTSAVAFY